MSEYPYVVWVTLKDGTRFPFRITGPGSDPRRVTVAQTVDAPTRRFTWTGSDVATVEPA
jgi:hypothetical protein